MIEFIGFIVGVAAVLLIAYLVLNFYPPLGGKASKEKRQTLGQSANYREGKFRNQITTEMDTSLSTSLSIARDFLKGNPNSKPASALPMESLESRVKGTNGDTQAKVTWFGHSALMVEIDGKTLLLDPMLGKVASPLPPIGTKRFDGTVIDIEKLPKIDAAILSHDHYDHLDYGTIKRLKDKVGKFFVPLGVGDHLERWGIAHERIKEHDWWYESEFEGLTLVCTPARHFSGRGLADRDKTLWCSWVIAGQDTKIYFSGDSGYGPHFAEIGQAYGPFDLTLMECGQYDERWAAIHMMPEETVQAHVDVQGKVMLPIHWAGFTLSLHDWNEPVERAVKAAGEKGVTVATPMIGETVVVGAGEYPVASWWR